MKILLVEDDLETATFVATGLRDHGYAVDTAEKGTAGLEHATTKDYAAIIVDRMLPELNGLEMVKNLRAAGRETPVLFLTTMSGIDDRVEGLEAGGDDYLVKPFAFSELLARVNALTRRAGRTSAVTKLRASDVELDLLTRSVTRSGKPIDLQPQEFLLLEYLVRNAGHVVTRSMLLEKVWDLHFDTRTHVVETHMSRLRAKIGRGFDGEIIHTVRGAGYLLRAG